MNMGVQSEDDQKAGEVWRRAVAEALMPLVGPTKIVALKISFLFAVDDGLVPIETSTAIDDFSRECLEDMLSGGLGEAEAMAPLELMGGKPQ